MPRAELVCLKHGFIGISIEDMNNHYTIIHNYSWKTIIKLPMRAQKRADVTQLELDNRLKKLCHCGKPVNRGLGFYKYCSTECKQIWFDKTMMWSYFKDRYRYSRIPICDSCGFQVFSIYDKVPLYQDYFEVDHIIAIVNGGDQWDIKNFQLLCIKCHKVKTKEDLKINRMTKKARNLIPLIA